MFEHLSERRRRWLLLTFCAVTWSLFANSLAHLGEQISRGGIGPDAVHAVGVIGTVAMWTAVWGAAKLSMRHWAFAALCGITLSSALVEFGFRERAAAVVWALECDHGNGPACGQLAAFYDSGKSPVHGWLDARRVHDRACSLGVAASCQTTTATSRSSQHDRCFVERVGSECRRLATALDELGQLDQKYEVEEFACTRLGDLDACAALLDSGYHGRRLAACEVLVPECRVSSARRCTVALRRCDRIESPHAGVD